MSSESLGIIGDNVNLVTDLGITKKRLGSLNLVLRPAPKHKFRFNYLPIKYAAEGAVQRDFTFNGQRYRIGLPVNTTADLTTYRFGYEYDFLYRDRGYLGVLIDLKYTNIDVDARQPDRQRIHLAGGAYPHARRGRPRLHRAEHLNHRRDVVLQSAGKARRNRLTARGAISTTTSTARSTSPVTSAPRSACDRSTSSTAAISTPVS